MPANARARLGLAYRFTQNRNENEGNYHVKLACSFPSGCCSGVIAITGKVNCWLHLVFQRATLCQFSVGFFFLN